MILRGARWAVVPQYAEQPTNRPHRQDADLAVENDVANAVTGLYAQRVPDRLLARNTAPILELGLGVRLRPEVCSGVTGGGVVLGVVTRPARLP